MGTRLDIRERYACRSQAEHYRDRFLRGRRKRTHLREVIALTHALRTIGPVDCVADIGCGTGRFASTLATFSRRLYQVDFSEHMLDVCRTGHESETTHSGHVQADARRLPFRTGSIDLVFCHRLLNHVRESNDRRAMLAELARISGQYVLMSCLGLPRPLIAIRQAWRAYVRDNSEHAQVSLNQFLDDANAVGLERIETTQIRSLVRSAVFITFRNRRAPVMPNERIVSWQTDECRFADALVAAR